ncbi:MAG: radical SAM family heme chaperone HemW [Candidatus Dormibacteria bacterium]
MTAPTGARQRHGREREAVCGPAPVVGLQPGAPAPPGQLSSVRALYLHVPFCERKCSYCDFVSMAPTGDERRYVDALRREIRTLARALPGVELDTVFIGGGTPGLLEPELLAAVLAEVRGGFALAADAEVTLEANPSSTSERRAACWLEAGCTRVSLGIQSLEPDVLAFLDRVHDAERAVTAVAEVRRAGFRSVNCDLIYAVPGLDDARWRATLDRVLELDVGHLSAYELTVEPGTPLHVAVRRGRVRPVDPEAALRQHWIAVERAAVAGFAQYEVSNFARPGQECRHNLVYWRNQYYAAAGLGAHGHLPAVAAAALGMEAAADAVAVRYWHGRSLPRYLAAAAAALLPMSGHESVLAADSESERLLLGLRLQEGVSVPPAAAARALALEEAGLLRTKGHNARLTRRGQEVLNAVALELVGSL